MCNNILNFEITKSDINDIFENYNIHDSTERRNFIQNLNNYLEVQAVPGSGKTKILGAKIGLLLKKWKFKNSGICVLMHTNVAKEEILKSCREIDKNCKMGCFPHFIGTIQEFVDRFLPIPYLRSNNFPITQIIDKHSITANFDDIAKSIAKSFNGKYFNYYEENEKNDLYDVISRAFYIEPGKIILCNNKEYKKDGKRFRKLEEFKIENAKFGYFLYKDMYAFANALIKENRTVLKYIKNRFKICFVDEAQDTNKIQGVLIKSIFQTKTNILQILGDINQKIYDFDEDKKYNFFEYKIEDIKNIDLFSYKKEENESLISMNTTYRFNSNIGNIVNMFSPNKNNVKEYRTINKNNNLKPYLILYDDPQNVLENFVEILVKNNLNTIEKTIAIIGGVNKDRGDIDKTIIKNYIKYFEKQGNENNFRTTNIIEALNFARKNKNGDFYEKYKIIFDTLYKALKGDYGINKSDFKGIIKEYKINKKIFRTIMNESKYTENFIKRQLFEDENFEKYFEIKKMFKADKKCNNTANDDQAIFGICNNQYYYKYDFGNNEIKFYQNENCDELKFKIKVDTIHGVKGESHNATLVLETFNHTLDVAYFLNNESKNSFKELKKSLYVAVSRPKELLCIASKKDGYSSEETKELSDCFEIL